MSITVSIEENTKGGLSPLIDLRRIVKVYQTPAGDLFALKDVSLQVYPGEFVAVVRRLEPFRRRDGAIRLNVAWLLHRNRRARPLLFPPPDQAGDGDHKKRSE